METIHYFIILLLTPIVIVSVLAVLNSMGMIGKKRGRLSETKEMANTYELIINRYKSEIKSLNGKCAALKQILAQYEEPEDESQPMITLDMVKPHLGKFGINPEMLNNPMIANLANEYIKKPAIQKQLRAFAAATPTQSQTSTTQESNLYEV